MKKIWLLIIAALLATTLAIAQQDTDDAGKKDIKKAGHNTAEAAKSVGKATKKAAIKVGHETKKGTLAVTNKVRGRDNDDRDSDAAERREDAQERARANESAEERNERIARERAAERNRNALPQADRETARDEALERSVHIVSGPEVDAGDRSATIRWATNKTAATDVWLQGGGIRGHRTKYERGGSRDHRVTFSNLRPNTTYTYIIRTREGGVRQEGTFTTR
jgi:hypothetical protein